MRGWVWMMGTPETASLRGCCQRRPGVSWPWPRTTAGTAHGQGLGVATTGKSCEPCQRVSRMSVRGCKARSSAQSPDWAVSCGPGPPGPSWAPRTSVSTFVLKLAKEATTHRGDNWLWSPAEWQSVWSPGFGPPLTEFFHLPHCCPGASGDGRDCVFI